MVGPGVFSDRVGRPSPPPFLSKFGTLEPVREKPTENEVERGRGGGVNILRIGPYRGSLRFLATKNRPDFNKSLQDCLLLTIKNWQKLVSSFTRTVWAKFSLKLASKIDSQPNKYERKNSKECGPLGRL